MKAEGAHLRWPELDNDLYDWREASVAETACLSKVKSRWWANISMKKKKYFLCCSYTRGR